MEIQTVRDLIQFLTSFDDNAAVEDVFKEKTVGTKRIFVLYST